ncbi:DEAD/DEAH box helicase [Mycoplasma cottewii]|uniref:DEAD/DEAH box helicase n=1 Tax=Mycoplasma cottewii TaxID=51364 RepID=A0ABY5TX15_9MOLU|nr:GxxExxY protein [Mycoplasma cottewii]UWD35100.1 DEAD/DEAH box helicase [Mycoplasma cottewii]
MQIAWSDVLILDEYQDISTEISEMLWIIKEQNPHIQIVAVGDLDQKIYDNTSLDVSKFISSFINNHKKIYFTNSFRMPKDHAKELGKVWNKKINGVNKDCKISCMTSTEVVDFLATKDPKDILCLGSRSGVINDVLNKLETNYSDKFNKKTVYASIKDSDQNLTPKHDSAIFTTFDSSKGLEKPICVVFDFELNYWFIRLMQEDSKYEILRNIFCVAASRGKEHIVFVNDVNEKLTSKILIESKEFKENLEESLCKPPFRISEMFDHKYEEDINDCYEMLEIEKVESSDKSEIKIKANDGLIDISPCIGIYQEASYFKDYNINLEIEQYIESGKEKTIKVTQKEYKKFKKERKPGQNTLFYFSSNKTTKIYNTSWNTLYNRIWRTINSYKLSEILSKKEQIQQPCYLSLGFYKNDHPIEALGYADVVKNDTVIELKFVNEVTWTHFLQTACYMVALGLKKGVLWNVRNNEFYRIKINNEEEFKKQVAKTITKRRNK